MKSRRLQLGRASTSTRYLRAGLALLLIGFLPQPTGAETVQGFTEPYQVIRVAAAETGILVNVHIAEGDTVQEGQPLAELDAEVYRSMLKIAEITMEARGRLDSAMAELELRKRRYEKLQQLQARGLANPEEVLRAKTDLAIAEGTVTSVREDLQAKKYEHERIEQQLSRRTVHSPLSGVVTKLLKRRGEFVSPNDPVVVEIVQLDPLAATFMVTRRQAERLLARKSINVSLIESRTTAVGEVEFVSPTTDAESGMVRVRIRLANDAGRLHSGERCVVEP